MPLKIEGTKATTSLVKPGQTDYSSHLEAKPIISQTSIQKKVVGGEWSGPTGVSKIEHPGVFNQLNKGCLVTVGGSRTFNLGNFESAKFEVSITIPVDPENIMKGYDWGCEFVSSKIEEAEQEIKK